MTERVLIIGGGFSGLAAAVKLSSHGVPVTVVERRGHLGGRAYSFTDPHTGDVVDNGQHLFMACYHQTVEFLDQIGSLDKLKFQSSPRVEFFDSKNGFTAFDCPPLPAPLHAVVGLLRMKGITLGDKLASGRVARAIRSHLNGTEGLTVAKWLDGLGQSERIKERFWYPMAIATLNQHPEIASARMMKRVLELGFGGSRADSALGISSVGLSDLYTVAARSFIESHGGEIITRAAVRTIVVEGGRAKACELVDGQTLAANYIIAAAPPSNLFRILPGDLVSSELAGIAKLDSSPIVSINLWLDRPVTDHEFFGLIGTRVQWLFNKDIICRSNRKSNHLALVISAADRYVGWTKQALVEMALTELREAIPEAREAKMLHSRVIKEREATISHSVDSDCSRPEPKLSIPNLILAGDWTDTGLPATIESAVVSGNTAAALVGEA